MLIACRHQAIIWNMFDNSSVRSCGNFRRNVADIYPRHTFKNYKLITIIISNRAQWIKNGWMMVPNGLALVNNCIKNLHSLPRIIQHLELHKCALNNKLYENVLNPYHTYTFLFTNGLGEFCWPFYIYNRIAYKYFCNDIFTFSNVFHAFIFVLTPLNACKKKNDIWLAVNNEFMTSHEVNRQFYQSWLHGSLVLLANRPTLIFKIRCNLHGL